MSKDAEKITNFVEELNIKASQDMEVEWNFNRIDSMEDAKNLSETINSELDLEGRTLENVLAYENRRLIRDPDTVMGLNKQYALATGDKQLLETIEAWHKDVETMGTENDDFVDFDNTAIFEDISTHFQRLEDLIKDGIKEYSEYNKASNEIFLEAKYSEQSSPSTPHQKIYDRFITHVLEVNKRHLTKEDQEIDLTAVTNDLNNIFDDLLDGILDEETDLHTDTEMEAILGDIRNTIIFAQGEMLDGNLSEHTLSVISGTVDLLKLTENKLEAELSKEQNMLEEVLNELNEIAKIKGVVVEKQDKHSQYEVYSLDGERLYTDKYSDLTKEFLESLENKEELNERAERIQSNLSETPQVLTKKTYLYVPYEQKEAAKSVGIKWDKDNKAWYAPKGTETKKIGEWLPKNQETKVGLVDKNFKIDSDLTFDQELEKRGFELRGPINTDGYIHRVHITGDTPGTKNGAYAVHQDGRPTLWLKDWKNGHTEIIKHTESTYKAGATDKEIKTQKEINRIKQLQQDKDLSAMYYAVSNRLKSEKKEWVETTTHPYLAAKGVQTEVLHFIDKNNNLVIPFVDLQNNIKTVQRIPSEQQNNRWSKYFEKGGEKNGSFAKIGIANLEDEKSIILCEGYSTGLTLYDTFDKERGVIVAGDAGNLIQVAQDISKEHPHLTILIASDNDNKTDKNPGLTAALEAERIIKENNQNATVFVVKPIFISSEKEKGLSDFNDLANARNTSVVKKQIYTQVEAKKSIQEKKKKETQKTLTKQYAQKRNADMTKEKPREQTRSLSS